MKSSLRFPKFFCIFLKMFVKLEPIYLKSDLRELVRFRKLFLIALADENKVELKSYP
jgi:hypothetical protein